MDSAEAISVITAKPNKFSHDPSPLKRHLAAANKYRNDAVSVQNDPAEVLVNCANQLDGAALGEALCLRCDWSDLSNKHSTASRTSIFRKLIRVRRKTISCHHQPRYKPNRDSRWPCLVLYIIYFSLIAPTAGGQSGSQTSCVDLGLSSPCWRGQFTEHSLEWSQGTFSFISPSELDATTEIPGAQRENIMCSGLCTSNCPNADGFIYMGQSGRTIVGGTMFCGPPPVLLCLFFYFGNRLPCPMCVAISLFFGSVYLSSRAFLSLASYLAPRISCLVRVCSELLYDTHR